MAQPTSDRVVDFPTLGFLIGDWIEAHCIVPDGFSKGAPFVMYETQLWWTVNHYRIRPGAVVGELAPAFHYRRSQIVGPQKIGKGPWSATIVLAEAAGPVVFDGWARGGEQYRCSDHGCRCGFVFDYDPGDPMGTPWPTPLIQLVAMAVEQVDNVYRPLQAMVTGGPLGVFLKVGEEFTRVGKNGRIDVVTSSAQARLGAPITFALQDETGLYTVHNKMVRVAETQRRGVAGMGGRSMETTNPWDPAEQSVAQRTAESRAADVFRFHEPPPGHLSFKDKRERHRILVFNYRDAPHVPIAAVEAEAAELIETDPAQAERFFGNRLVAGSDAWLEDADKWDSLGEEQDVEPGARITVGFDGSQYVVWTVIRARVVGGEQLYGFTPWFPDGTTMIWNPLEHYGEVPRSEVNAAVEHLFDTYDVVRMYCDPELWQSEIDAWVDRYGDQRVILWPTYRTRQMADALERLKTDMGNRAFTHDGDEVTSLHMRNARKIRRPGGVVIGKPAQHQKIDAAVSDTLAHEAAGDVIAAGLAKPKSTQVFVIRRR